MENIPKNVQRIPGGITAPQGFKAMGVSCGLKQKNQKDLALIYSKIPCQAAALFTTNRMMAAPLIVSKKNIATGRVQAIVVNSGNANSCTGEQGIKDALEMTRLTAANLALVPEEVLVASTGVIGVPLPMGKIKVGIERSARSLSSEGSLKAAQAIMTTDNFPKEIAVEFKIKGTKVTIGGIAKGAGMIAPHLATMLAFITSDVAISEAFLKECFQKGVEKSFNMITVDGGMSTNDMVVILANGLAKNKEVVPEKPEALIFQQALDYVCQELAKMIVKDGEGATKFIEIKTKGAQSFSDAKKAGMAIANSPLVKTALFGEDANWGRIVAALGASGAKVSPSHTDLYFDSIPVLKGGSPLNYNQKGIDQLLKSSEVKITVNLGEGEEEATVWTCDLSYEYVKINVEYRT